MKKLCLFTATVLLLCSNGVAQPPREEGRPDERPQAREGQRGDQGDRRPEGRFGQGRGPRDGQPPEGGRPGGPPGSGRGPGEGFGRGGFGPGPGPGGPGGFMAMFPVMRALDADSDGELSAEEIRNASGALAKLDKNEDGKIDGEEMRPEFPRGGFGGGPGGFGPPGGDRPEGFGRRPPMDEPDGERGQGPEAIVARLMNFDKDDDGKLSKDELPEQMQSMLTRGDRNNDGVLDREEVQAVANSRFGAEGGRGRPEGGRPPGDRPPGDRPPGDRPPGDRPAGDRPTGPEMAERILARSDANDDGVLSEDEAPEFLKTRFGQLDKNSDGKLDRDELVQAGSQMRDRGGRGPEGDGPPRRGRRPGADGEPAGEGAPREGGNRPPASDRP